MPVPASASSRLGAPSAGLGANTAVTAAAIARWPVARLGLQHRSACRASPAPLAGSTETVRGGGRSAASSHCARRENSMRSPASGRSSRAETSGAQPQPSRASVALAVHAPSRSGQLVVLERREQPRRHRRQQGRGLGLARRRLEPERAAQPGDGRHREPRRVDEGEQLEQVEARQVGIAEPLADQRRVEDDVRSFGRPRDRLAALRLANLAVRAAQPDSGVGCVEGGKRQRSGHRRTLAAREQKSNGFGRRNPPLRRDAVEGVAV